MLVSIFGHMNHGKSTFAKMLRQHLEYPPKHYKPRLWNIRNFAGPGKRFVADIMGVDVEFIDRWKNNPEAPPGWKKNVRTVLQEAISYWRTVDPSIWTNKALNTRENIILDDGRFIDELLTVNERRGVCIFIHDPRKPCDSTHESESLARNVVANLVDYRTSIDHFVSNSSTPDALNFIAATVAMDILERYR